MTKVQETDSLAIFELSLLHSAAASMLFATHQQINQS